MSHGPDVERCAVWEPVQHIARRPRRCDACRETIPAGVRYTKLSACFGGSWSHSDHCVRCWLVFEAICERTRDPVDPLLDCGESWLDAFGEVEPDDVASLAFMLPSEVSP